MNSTTLDRDMAPATRLSIAATESVGVVSWGAIFAGAAAAAALSLVLLVLGVGLGFTAMSPWAGSGASASAIGASSIVWLALTSIFASGLGGYLAGRLRTKWAGTHVDEVHFRDTAHGIVAWAVATLVTAGVMTSAIGTIVGAGATVAGSAVTVAAGGAAVAAGRAAGDSATPGLGYFTDSLFRRDSAAPANATPSDPNATASSAGEVTRIFAQDLRAGALTPDDTHYVGQLVAQRTGIAQPDAEKRVTDVFGRAKAAADDAANKAKDAADHARKVGAYASLWLVVSLLLGAFSAGLAATFGGRQRDL
jgi:hypothetical protein